MYDKICLNEVINDSKRMLRRLKDAVQQVDKEYNQCDEAEKMMMICRQADILRYAGNPLVVKSIDACRKYLLQQESEDFSEKYIPKKNSKTRKNQNEDM